MAQRLKHPGRMEPGPRPYQLQAYLTAFVQGTNPRPNGIGVEKSSGLVDKASADSNHWDSTRPESINFTPLPKPSLLRYRCTGIALLLRGPSQEDNNIS